MFPTACIPAAVHRTAGGGVESYERTAFVSSTGNDGTAALNNPALPYLTLDAALDAVYLANVGLTTTLRLLSDISGGAGINSSTNINAALQTGVTIMSHNATVRVIDEMITVDPTVVLNLTLSKVTVAHVTWPGRLNSDPANVGAITGDAETTIENLVLDADTDSESAVAGADGTDDDQSGNTPSTPAPNHPPTPGTPGVGASANGSGATGTPTAGNNAWSITLNGSGTIVSLLGRGGPGGHGAAGGNGGTATGSSGGTGGDVSDPEINDTTDGGAGGDGGNAEANGGNAVAGANGGNGSTINNDSWTIIAHNLAGGAEGDGALGGTAGTANAGIGGGGGSGGVNANPGPFGNIGSTSATAGNDGAAGIAGSDGSIV